MERRVTGSLNFHVRRHPALLPCLLLASFVASAVISFPPAGAQASAPVLISEETSTRALVFDSTTREREPFTARTQVTFGGDARRRLMIFAMNLQLEPGELPSAVVARAEDAAHQSYLLPVEHVGPTPGQSWATSIVLTLDPAMGDLGDVLVGITYRGVSSNRVRIGIGHVGGGPPDDPGAVPTPGGIQAPPAATAGNLSVGDVQTIISQAVSAAVSLNRPVTVAVTDREANVLGVFSMTGAPAITTIRSVGTPGMGLEGSIVPASLAAISKAGTGALFSTGGNAFTTRTAGFIIQEHFPPAIDFRPGGPLYGVQFSSLPCSDIKIPGLPLGLSGDPGGIPIYKDGLAVGGVGIEGDGLYTVDRNPADFDQPAEELIAASAVRGFEPPALIRGDNILVDGIRLPYSNVATPPAPVTIAFGSLPGAIVVGFPLRPAQTSAFIPALVAGIAGEVDPRFFPFIAGAGANALTAAEVQTIMTQAIQQANITRAAIRQPLGSNGRVTIAVVDAGGTVLGLFRQLDAPVFGFDVSVQKARTAAFFSRSDAATLLAGAGFGSYVSRATADGIQLNGAVAFSDRAIGFLHRPLFPDGINNTAAGPFSTSLTDWSPFNVGLELDLVKTNLLATLGGAAAPCTAIPNLPNGIQIFAGSTPLYKNNVLVGAIGISGDGIDQDDLVSAAGANGFSPAPAIRSDQVFVRSVRLPFLKFPRSPNL
ncbi:MAG TPA: heme-binding protein [Pyrinomonadaceae bacterium]|nr:heme-binding protein [Pyrinomonadaceae bacterium]